jgi:hypothetical protein
MSEIIETTASQTSEYTEHGGSAYRQPDMAVEVQGHRLILRHVAVANTGYLGDGRGERPIVFYTANLDTGRGQAVYLSAEEATTIGQSLLRLADPEYRERETKRKQEQE